MSDNKFILGKGVWVRVGEQRNSGTKLRSGKGEKFPEGKGKFVEEEDVEEEIEEIVDQIKKDDENLKGTDVHVS